MTEPLATLVVLNYDGRGLLDTCLSSVVTQRCPYPFEVVVVDNGSHDGSAEHVRTRWPEVRVVVLAENVGVTAALNVMVQAARGEFVALLNNDVELDSSWLALLVETLEAHPGAATAAGKLLSFHERSVIDRAGDELRWSSAAFGRGAGQPDHGQFDEAAEVFSVGGAAALYRRAAFVRVGPFDPDFFAYLEDVDWGFRARLAGYGARYEPRALGYHLGGATLGAITPFSLYHLRRNQLWLVAKNYPLTSLVRHAPEVFAFNVHAVAMAVRQRRLRLVLAAYRDALRASRAVLRKRRTIQRARAIGSRELERVMRS